MSHQENADSGKYAHYIVPLGPMPTVEEQRSFSNLVGKSFPVGSSEKAMRVGLLGNAERLGAISCTIADVARAPTDGGPAWTTEESSAINAAVEHMHTVIRLGSSSEVGYLRIGKQTITFTYFSDDEIPNFGFTIQANLGPKALGPDELMTSFEVTRKQGLQLVLPLLADGFSNLLPREYKFLSLYKAIEIEHPGKKNGKTFHGSMDGKFAALGLSPYSLERLMPELRAKAAHGLARGASEPGLSKADLALIDAITPILTSALNEHLAAKYGLKFVVNGT